MNLFVRLVESIGLALLTVACLLTPVVLFSLLCVGVATLEKRDQKREREKLDRKKELETIERELDKELGLNP